MIKKDLIEILLGIDEEASLTLGDVPHKSTIVIVGGAAFLLRDLTTRKVTHDIDILGIDDELKAIINSYPEINQSVSAYIDQIPYNFEDRLVELGLKTTSVRFVVPSLEDLIIMKLYAQRPNDIQDIESVAKANLINWNLLEHLVYSEDEAKASTNIKRRYDEMVDAFERFKKDWKHESNI